MRVPSSLREDCLRTGTMKGHGYVLLPSRLVGAVLGDSDVSTSAAWSTGHSAGDLGYGSTSPLEGQYTSM